MKGDIKQRIADTRAAIVAELAKLGLPAELVKHSLLSPRLLSPGHCVIVEEGFDHGYRGRGTGLVEARVSGLYSKNSDFRARTFRETPKKPIDAAKVAAYVATRQAESERAEALRKQKDDGVARFAEAVGGRGHREWGDRFLCDYGATAIVHHDRVEVSFHIVDPERVGPILDGLRDLLRGEP